MVSWLTELDGSYSLIRQNTGKKWAMEQTIASLSKDDYSAYINLKLRGGALQRGVKKHVVKIDRLMRPRRIANVLAGFTTAHRICVNVGGSQTISFNTCLETMDFFCLT